MPERPENEPMWTRPVVASREYTYAKLFAVRLQDLQRSGTPALVTAAGPKGLEQARVGLSIVGQSRQFSAIVVQRKDEEM